MQYKPSRYCGLWVWNKTRIFFQHNLQKKQQQTFNLALKQKF